MKLSDRINSFSSLGQALHDLSGDERSALIDAAKNENSWFTEESLLLSLKGLEVLLEKNNLTIWANSYSPEPSSIKTVGVAMAGNIPAVGFHDLLCVLISGHRIKAKLSSQDSVLMKFIIKKLITIGPEFSASIAVEEQLKNTDAMIATGSDNTARYFEYYFRNIPNIIRKNRSSCAVIRGEEPAEEFTMLGNDVFSYFGLGCRNVSKIYVPEDFDLVPLIDSWMPFQSLLHHHKYANNYTYQRSILLMNQSPFLDSGFFILQENEALVSPISIIYYERYKSHEQVKEKLNSHREKLQVITSAQGWFQDSLPFGKAQTPEVDDYADNVDTMAFLKTLTVDR
ncbi:acyl-CoA reductase [soil metagenome]